MTTVACISVCSIFLHRVLDVKMLGEVPVATKSRKLGEMYKNKENMEYTLICHNARNLGGIKKCASQKEFSKYSTV